MEGALLGRCEQGEGGPGRVSRDSLLGRRRGRCRWAAGRWSGCKWRFRPGQHVGLGVAGTAARKETSGRGLPAVGRSLHLRVSLYLKWLLLVWCQALPRGEATSPDSSVSRCVWIEKESINSVIISDSPEDVHQQLLVAASLSVNTTGERGALPAPTTPRPAPGLCAEPVSRESQPSAPCAGPRAWTPWPSKLSVILARREGESQVLP